MMTAPPIGAEPHVTAVMLTTADRAGMAARAVRCFESQTYPEKDLLVFPTDHLRGTTTGELRNLACAEARGDIVAHWDDDDWSHPRRIEEQVAMLQWRGADAGGYREMLFWDTRGPGPGEAWLYSNRDPAYCICASLCYWRAAWERHPFVARMIGEAGNATESDPRSWLAELRTLGTTSFIWSVGRIAGSLSRDASASTGWREWNRNSYHELRMIAAIHGRNTSDSYSPDRMRSREWRRVPEWDDYCSGILR